MPSSPRFPPPGYEGSYREAALPDAVETPALEPTAVPRQRVIATRPDDVERPHLDPASVARQDARVAERLAAQRRRNIILIVVVAAYVALRLILRLVR